MTSFIVVRNRFYMFICDIKHPVSTNNCQMEPCLYMAKKQSTARLVTDISQLNPQYHDILHTLMLALILDFVVLDCVFFYSSWLHFWANFCFCCTLAVGEQKRSARERAKCHILWILAESILSPLHSSEPTGCYRQQRTLGRSHFISCVTIHPHTGKYKVINTHELIHILTYWYV